MAALERIEGRGGQPARLFLSTRQTLNMLFRAAREAVSEPDRDGELAKVTERLVNTGTFRDKKFVEVKGEQDSAPHFPIEAMIEETSLPGVFRYRRAAG